MSTRTRKIVGGLLVLVIVAASTIGFRSVTHTRNTNRQIDALLATGDAATPTMLTEAMIAPLPAPLQRWLRWSGVVGKPLPTTVRLRQEGTLRLATFGWVPFTAEEYYSTQPPAFLWTADVALAPGISVRGTDHYIAGHGALDIRLLGAIPLASDDGPEMDEGALLRYLNEILWFPAAAVSPYISFDPVDDNSARATMTWNGVSGTAVFTFDQMGRPVTMTANRFDRDLGQVVRWATPLHDYGEFDGIRVPIAGEAIYTRPTGDYAYIRLQIIEVDYDVPTRF